MQIVKQKWIVLLLLMAVMLSMALPAGASGNVLWAVINEEKAVVYLPQEEQIDSCQIGRVPCTAVSSTPISELEVPIYTLIILDNSLSIPQSERPIIHQLLTNLVGNRMQGEQFTIATIEDTIHYLCSDESDYLVLSNAIDSIVYENQDTQLTDNLYQAVQQLHSRLPHQFSRIVIVSDGVDDKQIGYTRSELESLLRECNYPVYTIGCGDDSTAERKTKLENLFALSRITKGEAFYLGETTDTYAIVQSICSFNTAQQVVITLPDEVCDGTVRAVKIDCSGTEYAVQLTMPFGSVQQSSEPKADSQTPVPLVPSEEQEEPAISWWEENKLILLAAGGGMAVLLFVLILVLILRRAKKKKMAQEPVCEEKSKTEIIEIRDDPQTGASIRHWYDDLEQHLEMAQETGAEQADQTIRVFRGGKAQSHSIRFTNIADPGCIYEAAVKDRLVVGRVSSCHIVLEYPSVSRQQCEIFLRENKIFVRNLSQTNITQVNGRSADKELPLCSGSLLTMGDITMKVEIF